MVFVRIFSTQLSSSKLFSTKLSSSEIFSDKVVFDKMIFVRISKWSSSEFSSSKLSSSKVVFIKVQSGLRQMGLRRISLYRTYRRQNGLRRNSLGAIGFKKKKLLWRKRPRERKVLSCEKPKAEKSFGAKRRGYCNKCETIWHGFTGESVSGWGNLICDYILAAFNEADLSCNSLVKYKQGSREKLSHQNRNAPKHLSLFVEQRGESSARNKRIRLKEVNTSCTPWMGPAPLSFTSSTLKSSTTQSRRQGGTVAWNWEA